MKVYSAANLPMVAHMKNILEMHNIDCHISGQFRAVAVGEIPPTECWPELWVLDQSQAEDAKRIIDEALTAADKDFAAWDCPKCNERVEGQFMLCWNCGTSHPDVENK